MKESPFFEAANLMLEMLSFVAEEKSFALKGGTAINFFLRDLPRLSVEIKQQFFCKFHQVTKAGYQNRCSVNDNAAHPLTPALNRRRRAREEVKHFLPHSSCQYNAGIKGQACGALFAIAGKRVPSASLAREAINSFGQATPQG